MKSEKKDQSLRVGYSKLDITPETGCSIAGRPTLGVRKSKRIRDPLFVRAIHVSAGGTQFTLVSADLLLVTRRIHDAVSKALSIDPGTLLLCGTHTHSGPGGFWRGSKIARFMGPYSRETFDLLVSEMAETARDAACSTSPASLSAASIAIDNASENRRIRSAPVDTTLTLLRFDTRDNVPICAVSFGAHPVGGMMLEPNTMSADYPGELCRRLEQGGCRPLFIQGAAGGTNPCYLDKSLDDHIALMADALERGVGMAEQNLTSIDVAAPVIRHIPLEISDQSCSIFPEGLRGRDAYEFITTPLRKYINAMARQGLAENANLSIQIVAMGDTAIVGIPAEAGPGISRSLRRMLAEAGYRFPVIASLCGGYAGYVHLRGDYIHDAERGFMPLSLYENAMSVSGRDTGERIVATVQSSLDRDF